MPELHDELFAINELIVATWNRMNNSEDSSAQIAVALHRQGWRVELPPEHIDHVHLAPLPDPEVEPPLFDV